MQMHTIHLDKKNPDSGQKSRKRPIAFINISDSDTVNPETRSVSAFLNKQSELSAEILSFSNFVSLKKQFKKYRIIWIHAAGPFPLTGIDGGADWIVRLKKYVESGGKLMLTGQAVHYLNILGFEPMTIEDSTKQCIDEGYGRRLGFHAFRNHPVFDGLNGGAYILWPLSDMTAQISGFFGEKAPVNGRVVAVDWDYIFLREQTKLLFEYSPGYGKVLAVGGYMNFSLPNRNRAHLELFSENCLKYLFEDGRHGHYWDFSPSKVIAFDSVPVVDKHPDIIPPAVPWITGDQELSLRNPAGGENFWDVAGKRMVTMGNERHGIEEVWSHPFMALRDYEAGLKFKDTDTVLWLSDLQPAVTVDPSFFRREYQVGGGRLTEIIVNDPERPIGIVHYQYEGNNDPDLVIQFKSNLRWMWPYSEQATGSLYHWWDPALQVIGIRDQTGALNVIVGANSPALIHLEGHYNGYKQDQNHIKYSSISTDRMQVAGLLQYQIQQKKPLDVIFCGTSEGTDSAYQYFKYACSDPHDILLRAQQNSMANLKDRLMVTTPDSDFNTGYRWALVATDRFMVHTPTMGEALVAGYATTRPGWDGGHKINGRPGYAWYFGRDAVWSSFALLDYGDYTKVKSQLEFFNKYQDLTGKIFHEASTSGFIHYDAADATPLYVVLAGRYFRYSNDTAFLRKSWDHVKNAIEFCYSTDTDQDHLIENTNVGHGWVEGGELYGSHATLYMAGIWSSALSEAANMASFMNDRDAEKYRMEAVTVKNIINNRFWNEEKRFFAYGMNQDGSFRHEPTALPAVPILLGITDPEKAEPCLQQYASNLFSTNWGIRIVRDDSKMYKPTGYHHGSVWPLFTGWASLAAYKTGYVVQGFTYLMNNLKVYKNWGLGFVEEVLNGAVYRPTGVCPHQCWSETMVLQPAIEGLLGLNPDAGSQRLTFAPALPASWDSLKVNNIRIGNQRIDYGYKRNMILQLSQSASGNHGNEAGRLKNDSLFYLESEFSFSLDQGKSVRVEFMPSFPAGTRFIRVTLDGIEVSHSTFKTAHSMILVVNFNLQSKSRLIVQATGGISVLPVIADPNPGDSSEGMRIISSYLKGDEYVVGVEGARSTSGSFEIWSQRPFSTLSDNVHFLGQKLNISRFSVDFEPSEQKYSQRTIIFKYDDH